MDGRTWDVRTIARFTRLDVGREGWKDDRSFHSLGRGTWGRRTSARFTRSDVGRIN